MILTAVTQGVQPDYVALAMVLVLALIVAVMAVRKSIVNKKKAAAPAETLPVEAPQKPAAPGSTGQLKLHDVEPKVAAMVMAIVAEQMGKPLNELRFISIKEVQTNEV